MQKKLLVIAVAAAVSMPALAQRKGGDSDTVVTLYGKVYPELVFPSSSGATEKGRATCTICETAAGENAVIKRTEMESSNSRFGIRGHERLGPDLRAIFQLETQFLVDSNNTSFARRDSFVGLAHKAWGTVKLGRFDTPFKEYGDDVSFLSVSSGNFTSTSTTFRHIGFGPQNNAARFHERAQNAVQYESPDLGPFDFKVMYSANEGKTATRDPDLWSIGGKIELGPVELMLAHETHSDLFGLSRNAPSSMSNFSDPAARSKDRATAVALKAKFGKHEIGIEGNEKKYEESGMSAVGRVRSYKNNSYLLAVDSKWNNTWRTAFHYVRATKGECSRLGAPCNTDGLEGSQISIGAAYHFTRRTFVFLMANVVRNGYSATFNPSNLQEVNPGEDVRQVGLGIHTTF
jgi:predicted porin